MRFHHQAVIVLAVAPAVWLAYRALNGMLGVNPVEDLLLTTGLWAFRFLLLSLAVTPLRQMTGWHRVIRFRRTLVPLHLFNVARTLGLFAFFYGCLHLATYVVLDQGVELRFILADVAKRPFITAGMTAFLLMFPLAATSTRGAIRRLGRRWQVLHRLVYISAAAAALHFIWKVKVVAGEPIYYGVALILLLTFRALRKTQAESAVRRQPAQA